MSNSITARLAADKKAANARARAYKKAQKKTAALQLALLNAQGYFDGSEAARARLEAARAAYLADCEVSWGIVHTAGWMFEV